MRQGITFADRKPLLYYAFGQMLACCSDVREKLFSVEKTREGICGS